MSNVFRELLRKVGSGQHTSKHLTREEAATATMMILQQEATPAQIGAFLIAHRIKRPTSDELAGMLDAYDRLGAKLEPLKCDRQVIVLGSPYDGRSRTAPISPITALILSTVGCPVIMHGGDRTPTKDGIPLIEIWKGLGVNWQNLDPAQIQAIFAQTSLGFVYLPQFFPLAHGIVPYRDQVGKRPPFATVEMMWSPYNGDAHVVCGFVHPPTEANMRATFALRGLKNFTTIKGSEGSCDIPRDRTAIIGVDTDRLLVSAHDYGFAAQEVPLVEAELVASILDVLDGKPSELMRSAIWNGGFYLWHCGICADLSTGLAQAEALLTTGKVKQKLEEIKVAIADAG
jgi:anthranilate phosphoribosyltransferase